jgi:hypothetical protein
MSDEEMRDLRIRVRAYFLWKNAGYPEGSADQFWLTAEKLDAMDDEWEGSRQRS